MTPPSSPPDLWAWVAPLCAAASLAVLAGILGALRQINPEVELRADALTFGCVVVGGGAGWLLGRGLWRLGRLPRGADPVAERRLRRGVVAGLAALGGLVLIGFSAAAGGLPEGRRRDMIAGALLAVAVLSAVAWMVFRLACLLGRPDDVDSGDE